MTGELHVVRQSAKSCGPWPTPVDWIIPSPPWSQDFQNEPVILLFVAINEVTWSSDMFSVKIDMKKERPQVMNQWEVNLFLFVISQILQYFLLTIIKQ